MKAMVYREYGSADVLKLEEAPKPTPREHEVLIRVRAASLNPLDWHLMRGVPWFLRLFTGLQKPRRTRLGVDVAGEVEAAGAAVTGLKPGDRVFGSVEGAFAEYVCAPDSAVAIVPENVTFEQAAAVPIAGLTALQALRDKGLLQSGQRVLINGASGGVGTFAVQIAKWMGAKVTGICSTRNVDMVRGIGAERVIDYTREDFAASGERYDVIFDLVGNQAASGFSACFESAGSLHRVRRRRSGDAGCSSIRRHDQAVSAGLVYKPETGRHPGEEKPGRSVCPERTHEIRTGHARDRPAFQPERSTGGDPVSRSGTCAGQDCNRNAECGMKEAVCVRDHTGFSFAPADGGFAALGIGSGNY